MDIAKLTNKVHVEFKERFKSEPILIFSPGRINLIGEHTDYNNGFVFPAAINKGIVCGIQRNKKDVSEVYAIDKKTSRKFSLQNIRPAKNCWWLNYILGVVFGVIEKYNLDANFDIVFAGNLPLGAGLSSSAALENSIVFGLNELFNLKITKTEMIYISQKAEHNFVGVKCGIMDQYASMFGEQNSALLLDCRSLKSKAYNVDFKGSEIVLINTNVKHSLADSAYNNRREVCERIASKLEASSLRDVLINQLEEIKNELSKSDFQKAKYILEENERVIAAAKSLEENNISRFGELLFESHKGLQFQYKVSCDELDFLVSKAEENPQVLGARMMGGGFGGCTINIVKSESIEHFKKEIEETYLKEFSKKCSFYNVTLSKGVQKINHS